jgi:hypothetical protein
VEDLLLEMNIMKEIGPHPNVVTLLGVSTQQGFSPFPNTWIVQPAWNDLKIETLNRL